MEDTPMEGAANGVSNATQIKILFSTRHTDLSLPEDTGPILVSTGLRRLQLSHLVNSLLETERPVPFEFLVNGQFLRTNIDDFLTNNGISAEATLNVEYVKALIPPVHVRSFEHDDWVSTVDVLGERILSGSYDGMLRVWNTSGQVIATSSGGQASVKSARFLSSDKIVSGHMDRTVRIWNFNEQNDEANITPTLELYGHTDKVDSIAVHGPSSQILSASSDRTVGLWSTSKSQAPAAPAHLLPSAMSNKRRKLSHKSQKDVPQRGPLALLTGHTAPVSAAVFAPNDHTVAYSAAQDHQVKTWDLTTQSIVDTRTTAHPLLSLTALPTLNLLAAGSSARHITVIDPRANATNIVAMTLRGHSNAVVALDTDPNSEWGLVSGSHDGTCRVWDVRNVKGSGEVGVGQVGDSVYIIERDGSRGQRPVGGKGVKVFGVRWDREVGIVSAGEDKRVQINRAQA